MCAQQWLISEESVNTSVFKIYQDAFKQNTSQFSDKITC